MASLLLPPVATLALTNDVALTPPMGWNDWNAYGCRISESVVTNNANVIASNGMEAAGYQYIDIDDGWASSRNAFGVIQAYTNFPDGMAFVANYVHSKGLKLGVYTDDGTNTCSTCISMLYDPVGKDPGSFDYEYLDAFTYAAWGADYLKDDNCNAFGEDGQAVYGRMSDGLMKSGRPIVLCLCGGENGNVKGYESWSPAIGNYWRTTGDIGSTFASMISHIDPNSTTAFVAGPGRWNDPDMLEIGNGEFAANLVAAQTHFTMWCEMAAPLIAGDNVTTMSPQSVAILTNAEAIAVDQDPAGEQGVFIGGVKDSAEVWSKPLGYDFTTRAVVLLNRSTNSSATITCNWTNLAFQAGTTATVRDLWAHQDLGIFTNSFTAIVPPYGSMLLKIVGTPMPPPGLGTNYLSDCQPIYAYTGYGTLVPDKSIGGNPITLGGISYPHGIGVNSRSGIEYNLGSVCSRFQATLGVDNEEIGSGPGSVDFHVYADGREIYKSGFMYTNTPPQFIDLDVTGVRRLTLGVGDADDGINYDHGDWANALVIVTNNTPQMPETPAGLTANPGSAITLTWNPTLAAVTYNVNRATISGGPYTAIASVPITTFTDSNIVSGTTYYYTVSAASSLGGGSNSLEVAATPCMVPVAPTNVTAILVTNSAVILDWNPSSGATSYAISRFTGNTAPVVIAGGLTTTNFTDTNVVPGTINYYFINAANNCSQSSYSALAAASVIDTSMPPTWNGASLTGNNWSDAANWNGISIAWSNTLIFDGNNRLDNTNDTPAGTFYSAIDFNPGAGTFVLNGNPLALGGSISNNSSEQQVVALGLDFYNNISFNGTGNSLLIAGALTNTLAAGSTVLTLTGNGILNNLLAGGTNIIATSGPANWTLLDSGSSTTVPWVFFVNSGTFNFGSGSSAPVMRTTTPNNVPSDNQVGTVSGATGIFNLVGGMLTTASRLNTATALDSTGIVDQVGGTFNLGSQFQGANGGNAGEMSIVNLSGGTMNVAGGSGPFYVASRGNGVLNLSNSASLNCGTLDVARNAAGNTFNCGGTVNLDGGILAVNRVGTATANAQTGTGFSPGAAFNFNGGTLKAKNSSANFFQGSTVAPVIPISAIVQSGGAIIDDGGFTISFLEPLQHDNSLGSAPDGGLTKEGSGTLTLAAGATYTGNTTVNSGTLAFANDFALPSGAVTIMAINKSASPSNAVIQVAGNLTYAGTLMITNAGAISFFPGDNFKLFSAANYLGVFTNFLPAIPGVGLAWNTNGLTNGMLSVVSSSAQAQMFDVKTFGAIGDGTNLDSPAINAAIAAAGAAGGGTVTFPPGNYLSLSIHLTNNVMLYLSNNATILAANTNQGNFDAAESNPYSGYQDYGHSHFHDSLIWGENLTNVGIAGSGTITGNGNLTSGDPGTGQADKAITLVMCGNISITGVTVTSAGHFGILAQACTNMFVANAQILNAYASQHRDAFNLIDSSGVVVSNCVIQGSDDAMVLKSDYALGRIIGGHDIHILNCQILSTENNATQFGSETVGDFSDVTWSNLTLTAAGKAGIGITSQDGSVIDGVTYDNITMSNCACPIFLKLDYRTTGTPNPVVGAIRNIVINNVTAVASTFYGRTNTSTINGYFDTNALVEIPIENITFSNVNVSNIGGNPASAVTNYPAENQDWQPQDFGKWPSYGWYVRWANNIGFTNCQAHFDQNDGRPAVIADTVSNISFNGFIADVGDNTDYDMGFLNATNFFVTAAVASVDSPSPGAALRVFSAAIALPAVTNFYFEAESIPFVTNGAVAVVQTDANSSNGKWMALEATATNNNSYIEYTLSNIPAGIYQLNLKYKGNTERGIITHSVDGVPLGDALDQYSAGQTYPELSLGVFAFTNSGNHTVRQTVIGKNPANTQDPWASADRFALLSVNLPVLSSVAFSEANLVVSGSGGVAGENFVVLMTTNLALPSNQWQRVETNAFDGSGSFNFTNQNSSQQQFYRILMEP